jgi:minor capsid protein
MFLDEIAALLVAQGVGTIGQNIFKGSNAVIPDGTGPFLSLIVYPGSPSSKTHDDTATERPNMQLKARFGVGAEAYQRANNMIRAAYETLGGANGLFNVTLSGVFYLSITAKHPPGDTGKDEKGRATLTFNIDAEKQPS